MATIFAPINNFRNSAVCTVRISGENALDVKKYIPALEKIEPKVAKLVKIYTNDGKILDEALALYFKSPNSFTGEDILEVSLHSSSFIVSQFLNLLSKLDGFAFAKAGEFCLRAVQNEKISLAKAEAINKLIASESGVEHRFAMAEFQGFANDYYKAIKQELTQALALLETYIDFSEDEEISMDFIAKVQGLLQGVVQKIQKTLSFAKTKEDYDIAIAIVGKPNVGKSTLFNYLTNTNDAIVSQIAGTTRDAIRKNVMIGSFKVQIIDTAGIRTSADEIEQIGIKRAVEIAKNADVILHLQNDFESIKIEKYQGEIVNIWAKNDISNPPKEMISISVKNNDIRQLEEKLNEICEQKLQEISGAGFLCNERQKIVLQSAIEVLQNIDFTIGVEIISEEIRKAMHGISHLVGTTNTEEILGEIFSNFCIGK